MIRYRESLLREDLATVRSEYLAERQHVARDRYAAAQDFDKALLALSASSLAFSLTLLRLIDGVIVGILAIQISWAMFSLSVIATVIALFSSYHAFDQNLKRVKAEFYANHKRALSAHRRANPTPIVVTRAPPAEETPPAAKTGPITAILSVPQRFKEYAEVRLNVLIETMNWLAMIFFILGMIALVQFGRANLTVKEQRMAENRTLKPEQTVTKPMTSHEQLTAAPPEMAAPPIFVSPVDQGSAPPISPPAAPIIVGPMDQGGAAPGTPSAPSAPPSGTGGGDEGNSGGD